MNEEALFERCTRRGAVSLVRASDVQRSVLSPFALYCGRFADPAERDPEDPYQAQIAEQGVLHEHRIQEERYPGAAYVQFRDLEDGFRKCIRSMAGGDRTLIGYPLLYLPDGMEGVPDVLERREGPSNFGAHHYEVVEIKLARNIKDHHILQAAFYNRMVGRIQGYTPETFGIINMDDEETRFVHADWEDTLDTAIAKARRILDGYRPPPVFGGCPYPWRTYANRLARETMDVSLVTGIGGTRREALEGMGIRTVDDLLDAGSELLLDINGVGAKTAGGWIMSARALSAGRAIRKAAGRPLPERGTEIFLDLEGLDQASAEDHGSPQTDYLIGTLVRRDGAEEYVPFVARSADGEEEMLLQFLDFMGGQEDYAVYHWHHYERTHLAKMISRYGAGGRVAGELLSKEVMLDLHRIATGQFVFPVPGSGLKEVARWMGFEWQHADVGALSSITLYQEYVRNPGAHQDKLQMVLDYNRDDCKATAVVKDWLVQKQLQG